MPNHEAEAGGNGVALLAAPEVRSGKFALPADRCLEIYRLMVRSRAMEEQMIRMSKSGEGYFWIGGPGEEAFNVGLGLQVHAGRGPRFDYLHLHYRNSATLVALGMPLIDGIRQMAMTATDRHSMGRNFPGHFAWSEKNVLPVSSVIEIQFAMAPGTAIVQKRAGGEGITIVIGGDAGTAEGDFASCLVWSSRPGNELPVLIITMNNGWGISTDAHTQHGEHFTTDRGAAFGIPGEVVDGNDPIASWHAIRKGMEYCRQRRHPYMIEARVSRLYGHSSSSGALRVKDEQDCIYLFQQKLLEAGVLDPELMARIQNDVEVEVEAAGEQIAEEARPTEADVERFTYAPSKYDAVYPEDYTGLPS